MKIVTDLERVGYQAVNIAQRVLEVSGEAPAEPPLALPRMADRAGGMLKESSSPGTSSAWPTTRRTSPRW